MACLYLGALGSQEWIPDREKALKVGTIQTRVVLNALESRAGVAFLRYPCARAEEPVVAWLRLRADPEFNARLATAEGKRKVVEEALAGIADDGKLSAVEEFARLVVVGREACPALRRALGDKNPRVRLVAAHLLGEWGDRSAIPRLLELLETDEGQARFGCAYENGDSWNEQEVSWQANLALTATLGFRPDP